jgi:hypothetical protein
MIGNPSNLGQLTQASHLDLYVRHFLQIPKWLPFAQFWYLILRLELASRGKGGVAIATHIGKNVHLSN